IVGVVGAGLELMVSGDRLRLELGHALFVVMPRIVRTLSYRHRGFLDGPRDLVSARLAVSRREAPVDAVVRPVPVLEGRDELVAVQLLPFDLGGAAGRHEPATVFPGNKLTYDRRVVLVVVLVEADELVRLRHLIRDVF